MVSSHKEKREYQREPAVMPVRMVFDREIVAEGDIVVGWTENVSMGGMCINCQGNGHIPENKNVELYVGPPNVSVDELCRLGTARLVRCQSTKKVCKLAAEFVDKPCRELYAPAMIGFTSEMINAKVMLEKVVGCDFNILINGETGVGKNVFAEAIHRYSRGDNEPFVRVNCASIPHTLFESQLFGHEKGAFTDAHTASPGYFRLAGSGSILLDEISEMPAMMQAKLLRVLEGKEFFPVGGDKPVPVKCRIIATSNADLEKCMAEGTFRTDLYYRIAEIPIRLPALRERREEIPLLAEYFHHHHASRMGKSNAPLTSGHLKELASWDWPGNVRELDNCIKHQVLMDTLTRQVTKRAGINGNGNDNGNGGSSLNVLEHAAFAHVTNLHEFAEKVVADAESRAVECALKEFNGNRTKAAQRLGVSYRTLLRKIERYDIKV